jgi:uncharacterized protein (TIRG00374 family)
LINSFSQDILKKFIINTLKFLIFLSAGLFLFYLIYKDQDPNVLIQNLEHINYSWIILSLALGVLSHVARAIRWQMMVQPQGYKPGFWNAFFAVMSTYFANLAVPRLGEVTRPSILKKYEKIPFSTSFGTIVLERLIDLLVLGILTVILLLTQTHVFRQFVNNNPNVQSQLDRIVNSPVLYVFIGLSLLVFIMTIILWKRIKQTKLYIKFARLIEQFLEGLKSFLSIKQKGLFLFYTLLIWVFYFLMTYLPVFAFEATSNINILGGLAFFVIGSYGMVAPVQGGIGAWHFMVAGTMIVIGINDQEARVFALVVHAAQTLMIVVVGLFSTIMLPIVNRHK